MTKRNNGKRKPFYQTLLYKNNPAIQKIVALSKLTPKELARALGLR